MDPRVRGIVSDSSSTNHRPNYRDIGTAPGYINGSAYPTIVCSNYNNMAAEREQCDDRKSSCCSADEDSSGDVHYGQYSKSDVMDDEYDNDIDEEEGGCMTSKVSHDGFSSRKGGKGGHKHVPVSNSRHI